MVKDYSALLGKRAMLTLDGLTVEVVILDVREAYNRTDFKVTPVTGSGVKWFSHTKVSTEVTA